MMITKPRATEAAHVDELAEQLKKIPDQASTPEQAAELIEEVSQLLWAVSSLDPEAEKHAARSSYFARPADDADQVG